VNGVVVRGIATLVVLVGLAQIAQPLLVAALIPPWRAVIETLEPDFRVVELRAPAMQAEPLIELVVTPARTIIVGTRAIVPEGSERAAAAMSRGAAWLALTVFLVTLIAWPVSRPAREWPLRIVLGLPLLAALLLVDVPISLLGPLRSLIAGIGPGDSDAWIVGSRFLRGGGRTLVATAGAAFVCLVANTLTSAKHEP